MKKKVLVTAVVVVLFVLGVWLYAQAGVNSHLRDTPEEYGLEAEDPVQAK